MNATAQAIAVMQQTQRLLAGVEIVYVVPAEAAESGEEFELALTATVGATEFKASDELGRLITDLETRDYIVETSEFKDNAGRLIEPQSGHYLRETDDAGDVHIHHVTAPDGKTCWAWSGPYRSARRIHTTRAESS
jgi:hypothetical protein